MFGRNILVKPIWNIDDARKAAVLGEELFVHSIWPTIQGEGPHAGCPAIFVRLTGCNLRCHFCDTEFETGAVLTIEQMVKRIRTAIEVCDTDLIVLTGGEPMRQQIIPFLSRCDDEGWFVQIETAGTVWPPAAQVKTDGDEDSWHWRSLDSLIMTGSVQLVCSPKTPKIHDRIIDHCVHFKYIIRKGEIDEIDGLPNCSTQREDMPARIYRPDPGNVIPTIWLQPMAEYLDLKGKCENIFKCAENRDEVLRVAMKHGYRISLQQHRILGVE
jgi:organic radical activating enzyme